MLLGGISSLALNFFLPAHSRRRAANTQLSVVARRIDDLPNKGDPRVRTAVAIERRQLEERLRRLKFYDAQFPAAMNEIERGLTRLSTRLDLVAQMELALNRYWRQRCVIVSDDIEELRRQLLDLLKRGEPGDQDIKTAQALIIKLDDLVTNTAKENAELAAHLVKRAARLRDQFDNATTGTWGCRLSGRAHAASSPTNSRKYSEPRRSLIRRRFHPPNTHRSAAKFSSWSTSGNSSRFAGPRTPPAH